MDKRYNHEEVEREIQELWEKLLPYAFNEKNNKEVYSIDTPPPTASGSLHIGHIFSYTQTDLVARYKRMRGYNVFYPMGVDDNGLATERFVEKKHKIRGHMMKRSEFIDLCLKESAKMAKDFAQIWKSMGLSVDWTKTYSTISDRARKISQLSFIELYKKNLVYKKEEPALYCTTCRTTVAQAELDDSEVSTTFNDIMFKTTDGKGLIVATTRPELLPACVALFYHPDDKRYGELKGQKAVTPVFGQEVPILEDDSVDKEKGTGLVMCCTFGDQTDVMWYKKHNLPFVQIVGRDGKWTDKAGALAGFRVREARKKALELLKEAGALREQKSISHNVNVHERCKQEIEYLILNQWFVKILENREKFLQLADEIEWKPEFMKARYKDWVEHLGWDWCISRQRFYGVPFPVWICGDCGEILLADKEHLPVDPQEQDYPGGKCTKCSSSNILAETDVMDTWNTSSLTPQINNEKIPMSMRPQAHDIIRTWAFYTIVKAFYHNNSIPWKEIAISGHVSSKGRGKISKSKGNAPTDPVELLKVYPADAIRHWTANGRLGVDTLFSENQFKIGSRLLTKLWNAFRFCKEHIDSYEKGEQVELDELNLWVLHNLNETIEKYIDHFDSYEHTFALEAAERFFWHIFCDNYLELVKDRIFNPDRYDEKTILATRYTFYEVGLGILQMFAPFVPHITEKLYQLMYADKEGVDSLHVTEIASFDTRCCASHSGRSESSQDRSPRFRSSRVARRAYRGDRGVSDVAVPVIDKIVDIVTQVRKLKSEHKLSLKVELENLVVYVKDQDQDLIEKLKQQESILKGVTKAKTIAYRSPRVIAKQSYRGAPESKLIEKDGAWEGVVKL